MASLQERNGSFRFIFRYHGKQHFVTLGKVFPQEADAKAAQVEYLLLRLKQRLIELPPGIGSWNSSSMTAGRRSEGRRRPKGHGHSPSQTSMPAI